MKRNQKGFTLIELMIVVAIIGILAAIAIPKFAEMLEKSRDGATKGNIGALKSAVSMYYGDHEGQTPTDLTLRKLAAPATDWGFLGKYIDDVPGVKSLGENQANGTNKGKGPGKSTPKTVFYLDFTAATSLAAAATIGYGYRYDASTAGGGGGIWVNSTLVDMNDKPYSLFGYE